MPAAGFLEKNGFFEASDLRLSELGEFVIRVLEELGEKEVGGVHDGRKAAGFLGNYPEKSIGVTFLIKVTMIGSGRQIV